MPGRARAPCPSDTSDWGLPVPTRPTMPRFAFTTEREASRRDWTTLPTVPRAELRKVLQGSRVEEEGGSGKAVCVGGVVRAGWARAAPQLTWHSASINACKTKPYRNLGSMLFYYTRFHQDAPCA